MDNGIAIIAYRSRTAMMFENAIYDGDGLYYIGLILLWALILAGIMVIAEKNINFKTWYKHSTMIGFFVAVISCPLTILVAKIIKWAILAI